MLRELRNYVAMTIFARLCQYRFQDDAIAQMNALSPLRTDSRLAVIHTQMNGLTDLCGIS